MKLLLALTLALGLCSFTQSGIQSEGSPLVITHAVLIDGTGAASKPDMSVLIERDRIVRVDRASAIGLPRGARVIDATGKFLIPGLQDMHVHLGEMPRAALQRLLESGVTGVRDMASSVDEIVGVRREASEARSSLPRVVIAGPILQGPLPFRTPPLVQTVTNADDARRVVNDLKTRGVDFIKVGDTLSREAYFAVAEESKRRRIPFAGHLPTSVSAVNASRAGQRSIEHFGSAFFQGVLIGCSSEEPELQKLTQRALDVAKGGGSPPDATLLRAAFTNRLVKTYKTEKAAALFSTFARRQTWQVPTLRALHSVWDDQRARLNEEDFLAQDSLFRKYSTVMGEMRRAGVKFLAGSDLPMTSGIAPLHDELVSLVHAGMPAMDALLAATRNPAEFLGTLSAEGTVEAGKRADLVLLDADPLTDISNTRRTYAVVLGGRVVSGPRP